jgi:hypothetical protein
MHSVYQERGLEYIVSLVLLDEVIVAFLNGLPWRQRSHLDVADARSLSSGRSGWIPLLKHFRHW